MTRRVNTYMLIIAVLSLNTSCSQNNNANIQLATIEYSNPILHLDYSDPDLVQVGKKYYMTASSFNCIPGLPLLESDNLVDWKLIGYAIYQLEPVSVFSKTQHGNGVWAPSIRYHNNLFYIFYGDPDYGIYMLTAKDFNGIWSKPHLVKAGKGWIDPCPFWDVDGKAWLVHAWAGSRAGIKSTLTLHKMSSDGKKLLDNGIIIFDGHNGNRTVEGPKMYKRNGIYYILAPAGGVTEGWQLALHSKNVTGPYEAKRVLEKGTTEINGPHQGALVDGHDGSSWFYHFQDKGAFGRVVHLQPVGWVNHWPVMGKDVDGDGCGEPVSEGTINSFTPRKESNITQYSDEFNNPNLNLHWQWHANPTAYWSSPTGFLGYLRLNAVPFADIDNLWEAPNLLMQKFPNNSFTAATRIELSLKESGDRTGLLIMGYNYAYLGVEHINGKNTLVYRHCNNANKNGTEKTIFSTPWEKPAIYIKTTVNKDATCSFHYSYNGEQYITLPETFAALPGKWIGAKTGLFCISNSTTNDAGYVNVDWFRFNLGNNN